jgi:CRISPR system Cascade subunit CasB
MSMTEATIEPRVTTFIQRLERLDAAGRARLKRNAGRGLTEARDVYGLFYGLLPAGLEGWAVERYFLVATLFPLADGGGRGSLGHSLRAIRHDANRKGLDRRVEHLLDADREQLPFRLRQALHYLRSQRGHVAWPVLLTDLMQWDHPGRRTQRRWAEDYFVGRSIDAITATEPAAVGGHAS